MKNIILLPSIVVIFFTSMLIVDAQKIWSLEDCINYAHENNIQLKRQKLYAEVSENNYKQSKSEVLPNLNAGGGYGLNYGHSLDITTYEYVDENTKSGNLYTRSSVPLFKGLQNYNTIRQNEFNLQKNLEDVEKAKNDITLNIATAYLQILFSMELLDVAESQLEVTSQQIEKTEKLVDVGNVAKSQLLDIKAQAASEQVSLINAENNLKIAYLSLTQLLDLDSTEGFIILKPAYLNVDTITILESVEEVYMEAVVSLPQIKSAEYQLKSSEYSFEIAKGYRYPSLDLNAGFSTFFSSTLPLDYSTQLENNISTDISIGLSIPIFNRFTTKYAIQNAKINVLDSRFFLELEKQNLYKEIQQAHADAIGALEKYNASKEAVAFNEESFNYTAQKFEVGLISSVDYNVAKNNLFIAKSNMLQAKYEYIFKTKILDFYIGEPIVL